MLDSRQKDRGLEPHWYHCVVYLSKTHYSLLSTGSTQEDLSRHSCKIVEWDVKKQVLFRYMIIVENVRLCFFSMRFCVRKIRPGYLKYQFFVAKQQSTSLSVKYLDMLLLALQAMHIMVTFEMFE